MKIKIKKIFIVLILLSFLFLNTQSEAKEKSLPLGIMVLKEAPLLFVDMVKVTPSAFIPLTNAYVAETNQVYNESKKRFKVEYVKYQEELLYGKKENEEEALKPLTLEDKPLSNPIIDEAKNLDNDMIKKIIFDSENSSIETHDLISKNKTKYEKIRQTPVLGAIEQAGEAFVLVPAAVGAIGVFLVTSLTVIPASIYAGMTKDWYNNIKTIRNCDLKLLELDKELETKEKKID